MSFMSKARGYPKWLVLIFLIIIQFCMLSHGLRKNCKAPSFIVNPINKTSPPVDKETVKLWCRIKKQGFTEYIWYKDGRRLYIDDNPRIRIRYLKFLKIKKTTSADSGNYKCVARNKCGLVEATIAVAIKKKAQSKLMVGLHKRDRNLIAVPVGNTIRLDCSAKGDPLPTVTWYKDGKELKSRHGQVMSVNAYDFVLKLRDVVPGDSGSYTCNVTNEYGWFNRTFTVDVHERIRAKPLIQEIANVTAWVGQNATIECKVLSDSMPHFQWIRWFNSLTNTTANGKPFKVINEYSSSYITRAKYHRKSGLHTAKLTISNVTKKDQGRYSCVVGNAVGYSFEHSYLTIKAVPKAPPKLMVSLHKRDRNLIAVPVGNTIRLDCSAKGDPLPTVTWYKDGKELKSRHGQVVSVKAYDFVLRLRNVVPGDSGSYTCNVTNAYGWFNRTFTVDVFERIRAKPLIQEIANVTAWVGQNVTIECKVLSDSVPYFQWIRWFNSLTNTTANGKRFKVINENDEALSIIFTKPKLYREFGLHTAKLTLSNVTKEDQGRYSCKVGNALGFSYGDSFVIVKDDAPVSAVPEISGCSSQMMIGLTREYAAKTCKEILDVRSSSSSGIYWINPTGSQPMQVKCDMEMSGGGWTLVWSYTFTNYKNFTTGSNAVTPQPSWSTTGNVVRSVTPPLSETHYAAMNFSLWKEIGNEFIIKSNINHWIACKEGTGSLVNWKTGSVKCHVIKNVANKCHDYVPDTMKFNTAGDQGNTLGPDFTRSQSSFPWNKYYYFKGSTITSNWPTHDPCGTNAPNYVKGVSSPYGNIYVR